MWRWRQPRLGAKTAFVGKVGQDGFGHYLREVLTENGVDITGLHTDRSPTSLAVVSVSPDGERAFRFMRGADANLSPDEIDEGWVDRSKVLHFGSVSLTAGMSRSATIFAARRAHKTGKLVSYDPNYRPSLWRGQGGSDAVASDSSASGRHGKDVPGGAPLCSPDRRIWSGAVKFWRIWGFSW